ncbi:ATP-binding protein [Halomonas heilongjiangensis]|uniref:histidine kinase n=1 Tax=Halomonas heilongjiangensis TaxID=1387883 RepID=A0A2N7TK25_9GAMM|nr:ATP-binding protein [Halomonas heilongjiangensis]PMR68499.1 sensor histidine kinase [Halomonas heilongjiangensis]PXX86658.1 two-component sensor histidine kinase [Halomonas heilongjiangensis]
MKPRLSLKKRIALTYILLAVAVAGAFSLVSYISVKVIEEQVIDARLAKMAERLIEFHRQGHMPDAPPEVRFLIDANIPVELRRLPAGFHELKLGNRQVHALLRDHGTSRYAVVQEVDELEHTELVILLSLAIGFAVSVLLAAVLGVLSARRVIAPVAALADAVSRNAGPTELPSLSAQDEIGVLSRAFAKRTDELQQFLQREQLFTGDVSHELRTPLTVILGAAEVLAAQLSDHPAQYATAERIRRVADETAQRVSALLLLSRVPESLDAPRIVLNTIVESEMERCRPLLDGKTVKCRLDWTERVSAQVRPELAGIVIGNLLRNACRHTDQGMILVQLAAGRLVIEDTGTGIPQRVRERLFERFVHGDDRPAHEGTGLGLSIVKRVAEHIGWDVRLEIPEVGGTRFVLSFPAVPLP